MAKLYNLARMQSSTTGTGPITLTAVAPGYYSFARAGVVDGEAIRYTIVDGAQIEQGRGIYDAAGPTLTRSAIQSTNGNLPLDLSGEAEVTISDIGGLVPSEIALTSLSSAGAADGLVATADGAGGVAWEALPDGHDPVTVADTATIDLTLTGQQITAAVKPAGIDAADLVSGAAADGQVLTADGAGGAAWEALPGLVTFLTSPLTSTDWDGDARSTTAKTLLDLSAVFAGVPAGVKAVYVTVGVRDSGSAAGNAYLILAPNGSTGSGIYFTCAGLTNDALSRNAAWVPCDANGDIYFQVLATGAGTLDAFVQVWGWMQ